MMIQLREVTDIPTLMKWRAEVILHVFGQDADKALLNANRDYYKATIGNGNHKAFIASDKDQDYGCGGVCFSYELPSPDNPTGKCAYLMNIYVRDEYRNHGVAHIIVRKLIEEAKNHGCGKIYLETTSEGKPVYSSLGFKDMPDMMKYYDTEL